MNSSSVFVFCFSPLGREINQNIFILPSNCNNVFYIIAIALENCNILHWSCGCLWDLVCGSERADLHSNCLPCPPPASTLKTHWAFNIAIIAHLSSWKHINVHGKPAEGSSSVRKQIHFLSRGNMFVLQMCGRLQTYAQRRVPWQWRKVNH